MTAPKGFWICFLATLSLLIVVNMDIVKKERQLAQGTVVRVALAPVDPRSLMQGDYMALSYALEDGIQAALTQDELTRNIDGYFWVSLDDRQVAHFIAIDRGALAPEHALRLQFRQRERTVKLASNAWFFQEGQAARFALARYGEFRLGSDGSLLLAALLDEKLNRL
ncbi:GDYXXLXY domain-containing protein [Shewanella sp.]|uniref:GDYXXLXY domain-containing protein n=1 Tax=Shewanella sp. TaxID=50422 RepID=UPI00356B30E3